MILENEIVKLLIEEKYEDVIKEINLALQNGKTDSFYYYYRFLAYNGDYFHMDYNHLIDEVDLNAAFSLETNYYFLSEFNLFKNIGGDIKKLFYYALRKEDLKLRAILNDKFDYSGFKKEAITFLGIYVLGIESKVTLSLTRNVIQRIVKDLDFPHFNELSNILPLIDYINKKIEIKGNEEGISLDIKDGILRSVTPNTLIELFIPDGVKKIGDFALKDFKELKMVRIPESIEEIGDSAFLGCSQLMELHLPNSLKRIKNHAFSYCESLEELKLPESLEEVGEEILLGLGSLKALEIPNSLFFDGFSIYPLGTFFGSIEYPNSIRVKQSSLGKVESFYLPKDLNKITITLGKSVILGIPSNTFMGLSQMKEVILHEGIEEIYNGAFYGCFGLKEIEFPKSIKRIDSEAFRESGLKKAILPEGLVEIGAWAFSDCKSLSEVYIPSTIKNIGYHAFLDNTKIYLKIEKKNASFYKEWTTNLENVIWNYEN